MAEEGSCILLIFGRKGCITLNTVFLFEFVDAAASIQKLLFTRVEWVALGTDLYAKVLFNRTRLESVATSASNCSDVVCRMYTLFHCVHLFFCPEPC